MGKKAKLGKRRRDKYYHLAKETGYRARSAFKLIQLNRKFHFLQQSRVLIDLCAAPGGWLQVASNHMPMSSIVIGVDLVKIKPIHNVITIQADITTQKCKQLLQKELKTWKADCVLNDGSPNVGSAWLQDAFSQAELTLSALKLASEFLKPGGTFVTKVFRSKDYQSLLNTFQQLFKKVHATKPQASRNESAEIFVVCQGYKPTKKPDPNLLDPKFVFQDQDTGEKPSISMKKIQYPPRSAEGYDDDRTVLFESSSVVDFISSEDHMTILAKAHQLKFDKMSEVFARHPLTTEEVKEYCKDVKVLGLKELKVLLKWRERMRQFLDEVEDSDNEMEEDATNSELVDIDLKEVDERVKELEKREKAEIKSTLKRQRKQQKKNVERLKMHKETHCEVEELISDNSKAFSLKSITNHQHLEALDNGEVYSESEDEKGREEQELPLDPFELERVRSSDEEVEEEAEEPLEWETYQGTSSDSDSEEEGKTGNPLLVKLGEDKSNDHSRRVAQWFSNKAFKGLNQEEDEDIELQSALRAYGKKRGREQQEADNGDCNSPAASDDEDSSVEDYSGQNKSSEDCGEDFEVVPQQKDELPSKVRKLDPAGLAIGAVIVRSKKKRLELIESGYNRWTHNEDDYLLPDWFRDDENKHCRKQLPITKEMVEEYRKKLKEINARPIKKIAEAKARKKHRAMKKLESVRKRAQVISDTADVTDQEKAHQIRNMYKKAGLLSKGKQEVKYVVAKKGMGKRVKRPSGVSGKFKVVDPRMKKDNRKKKTQQKKKQKKSRGH